MGNVPALLLFLAAGGCLALAGSGVRLLIADLRLRDRLASDVPPNAPSAPGLGALRLPVPRLFLARGRDRSEIERSLRDAGQFDVAAVDRFVWGRLAATLAIALAGFAIARFSGAGAVLSVFVTFASGGIAYIGAKYWLKMRAADRERKLTAEFPFLLDLMLMMLESGISLDQCFRSIARDERIAVPFHGPLMATMVEDLDRGQDYHSALDRWAARVAVFGAKELATLFRQSLFQGMELAPALREFIVEFSQRRVARAREAIGRITVRMVVLMLIFFMPALFIVLGGPPIAAILDTLKSTGK